MGDYNQIMWTCEKKGGNITSWQDMRNFREAISHCSLSDLGPTQNAYTWSNGRKGNQNIQERLDRALASGKWKQENPNYKVRHLSRFKSDHSPIIIDTQRSISVNLAIGRKYKFRFEHMWMQSPNFKNILRNAWDNTHMADGLQQKLERCGAELHQWASGEFGSVRKKKRN